MKNYYLVLCVDGDDIMFSISRKETHVDKEGVTVVSLFILDLPIHTARV